MPAIRFVPPSSFRSVFFLFFFFLFLLAIARSVHTVAAWGIKAQSCSDDTCRLHIVLAGASTGT